MANRPNSPLKQVTGLLGDIGKLGGATLSAGLRITGEATAKARPYVQRATASVNGVSLMKREKSEEQPDA